MNVCIIRGFDCIPREAATPPVDCHDLFLLLLSIRRLSLGFFREAALDASESAVVDPATTAASSLKSLAVPVLSASGGLCLHPRIVSILVYRLQVQRSLLVKQMPLDGIHLGGCPEPDWVWCAMCLL